MSALLVFVSLSCQGDAPTGPTPPGTENPAELQLSYGSGQSGPAGSVLPGPLSVKVLNAAGKGVAGVPVAWSVGTGGGTLSVTSTTTDVNGEARTTWTLGTSTGTYTVTATVSGLAPVTFTATVSVAAAAKVERVSGDGQTGAAGAALSDSLAVRVTDAYGNVVVGRAIGWTVTAGGGSLSFASGGTDATGVAKVRWTLGATPGAQAVEARAEGLTGSPVAFRATATEVKVGNPSLSPVSGDAQSGTVGAALANPVVVKVMDGSGNPLGGVAVTWAVTAGGGSITPGISTTDASGLARGNWTLGTQPGANTVTATAVGATVTFRATGATGPAAALAKVSGEGQSATVGGKLANPLVVKVTDAYGNAVAGASVAWSAATGGGSLPAGSTTDASGLASAEWTLGSAAGANTATATVQGLPAVTFSATGTAAGAGKLAIVGGDGQSGTVGGALAAPLVVRVTDGQGNAVSGATVAWSVTAGGGSVGAATSTTDGSGEARTTWTLGTRVGANSITAGVNGLSVTFNATGTVGSAANLAAVSGDGQSGTVGTTLGGPLVVKVTDSYGNPVAGTTVAWVVTSGGGSASAAGSTTGADGLAQTSWTLGATAGAHTLEARVSGLSGSPVVFHATATAASLVKVLGDGQTGTVGRMLTTPLKVRVTDARGNPVSGSAVTWSVVSGGGSVSPASVTTGAEGEASTMLTLGATPGANQVSATAGGLSVTFTATAVPVAPAAISKTGGDAQTGTAGAALGDSLAVRVTDADGNPLGGASVTWSVAGGGGSVSPASATTGATGIAKTAWTLGPALGNQAARASVGALSPVTFTATATQVPVATVEVSPASPSVVAGAATQLAATTKDAGGNVLTGRAVAWSSSSTSVATVSASGLVSGVAAGTATITATSEGRSGTTTVTVTPSGATQIRVALTSPSPTNEFVVLVDGGSYGSNAQRASVVGSSMTSGSVVLSVPAGGPYRIRAGAVHPGTTDTYAAYLFASGKAESVTVTEGSTADVSVALSAISASITAPTSVAAGSAYQVTWTVTDPGAIASGYGFFASNSTPFTDGSAPLQGAPSVEINPTTWRYSINLTAPQTVGTVYFQTRTQSTVPVRANGGSANYVAPSTVRGEALKQIQVTAAPTQIRVALTSPSPTNEFVVLVDGGSYGSNAQRASVVGSSMTSGSVVLSVPAGGPYRIRAGAVHPGTTDTYAAYLFASGKAESVTVTEGSTADVSVALSAISASITAPTSVTAGSAYQVTWTVTDPGAIASGYGFLASSSAPFTDGSAPLQGAPSVEINPTTWRYSINLTAPQTVGTVYFQTRTQSTVPVRTNGGSANYVAPSTVRGEALKQISVTP